MIRETLKNIGRGWQGITDSLRSDKLDRLDPNLEGGDLDQVKKTVEKWLKAKGGEVSARRTAAQIGNLYLDLNLTGRHRFFQMLANDFGSNRKAFRQLCQNYLSAEDDQLVALEGEIREAMVTPRLRLLRQFNVLPQGIKFLVDLRADLLKLLKDDPTLKPLDQELQQLLATWFDVGLLDMEQITWQSPASLLEKLIEYEAVHRINSWQDMRHRLDSDRRCYAFFHRNMPDEPLIFVEVALVNGIARSVQDLLDDSAPDLEPTEADAAIFYSISNAQKGLQGISFGNFLIKRVVEKLKSELPNVETFSTLSPIPTFCRWLDKLTSEEVAAIVQEEGRLAICAAAATLDVEAKLPTIIENDEWFQNPEVLALLQPQLELLLYHYFHVRRSDEQPIDPVERFHLGNGARIEQINWQGDISEKGISQSLGFMVNYLYPINEIDKNHEQYAVKRRIVLSSKMKSLGKEIDNRAKRRNQ